MPMDLMEMHNVAADATAKYMDWKQKFLAQWQARAQAGQLGAMFASLPPALKYAMQIADEKKYAQLASALTPQQ